MWNLSEALMIQHHLEFAARAYRHTLSVATHRPRAVDTHLQQKFITSRCLQTVRCITLLSQDTVHKVAGAAAGAALALTLSAPALAVDLPFFGDKNQGGTLPQGWVPLLQVFSLVAGQQHRSLMQLCALDG
jgi:hypothetical protein